ncbi:hypothetical protein ACFO5K_25000 [Nocardia halotolerans]|uniref:DUF1440 domain-containing protein n=1 Tax=Nocardia halotolerans TaxID=1755878 RepID=A0ABV8VSH7_9NOCA
MATSASSSPISSSLGVHAIGTAALRGAVAGVVASLVMAMYAMIAAATYQHTGFFTPLYHIASTFIAPDAMMSSMMAAGSGSTFTFEFGPAVLGAVIHMMVGAMYGAMFAVIARMARLHGVALIVSAVVWGAVVFAVSAWIGLPLAAAIFGGGDPIADMASMVGYPTFLGEHLLFGGALGLLLAARPGTR